MSHAPKFAAAAALTAVLAAAGCGSSNNNSTTPAASAKPAISKADFLTQANAICAAGNAKTDAIGQTLGNHPSKAAVATAVAATFVPAVQGQIDAIRALGAQSADASKVSSMLDLAETDLTKVKSDPTAIFTAKPFHNFAEVAHAYGLTNCAKGS